VIHPLADPSRAQQSYAGFSSVLFLFATQKHISNVGGPKTFNPQTLLADPKECRRRWGRLTANGMLKCLKQVGETEPGQFSRKKKDCFFLGEGPVQNVWMVYGYGKRKLIGIRRGPVRAAATPVSPRPQPLHRHRDSASHTLVV
jgi:hypothetical protein